MKKFLKKVCWFFLPFVLITVIGFILPVTPRASKSLLMAEIQKDSLLQNTPSPRIIFVGGSNLSFGIDSKRIRDSLHINPINTAIHASFGLKFMMDNTLQYVRKNDIVLLVPEYFHFYRSVNFVSEELLRTILDVKKSKAELCDFTQLVNLIPYVPAYVISKFNPTEYLFLKESDIYSVNSFNEFGDVSAHWNLGSRPNEYSPGAVDGIFNEDVVDRIKYFNEELNKRGCKLLISYPSYEASSFDMSKDAIKQVEDALNKLNVPILGTPERYKMADTLMFNTVYHLNKQGVDLRTGLLIEDLKPYVEH